MRSPPSQSLASGLVVRLAVVPVRGRLMRSQTSELGRRICSLEKLIPDVQGLSNPEDSIRVGAKGEPTGDRRGGRLWHGRRRRPGNLGDP